jgi:spermine/spermidine synthase
MSQSYAVLEPPPQVSPVQHLPAAGIALVSFATLLLELGLTRLFSVVLFYHFAFLSISIALLGLGAGGVFAYVRKSRLESWDTRRLGARLCLLSAFCILLALVVVLRTPVSLQLRGGNFLRLTFVYLFSAVPFFFTGLLFSVAFARQPQRISHFYGADLMGGAAACMATVPLLNLIGAPNAIIFAALAMAVAGAVWAEEDSARRRRISLAGLLLVLIAANLVLHGKLADIVYAKGIRRDPSWVEYAKWNAISRVEVDRQGNAKAIVIDADASTYIMSASPAQWQDAAWRQDLNSAAPAVVNVLRPQGDYAIIGPGGGVDVLRALVNGSKNVTAIEINPIIATDIMRGRYADYAYHLYQRPEVHLHVQDGRSFIRSSKDKYDVIQMTLVDTWASTAAGAFALSENNLYTVEAFKEYFDHLKPDGIIAITRWEFKEPREALRVVSQGIEALREMGDRSPESHFIVVSDGKLNQDGRPVLVMISKSGFSKRDLDIYRTWMSTHGIADSATGNLEELYSPPDLPATGQFVNFRWDTCAPAVPPPAVFANACAFRLPEEADSAAFYRSYPYNIAPVHDNNPFFFFTFKTQRLIEQALHPKGHGIDWKVNVGVAVLFMVLVISLLAVLAFLILPLAIHTPARSARLLPLLYFVAVGLGYILVEITFIQRFVLFLGHPTYALTVVIFLLLLSSGAGSLMARRWLSSFTRVLLPLTVIVGVLLTYLLVLPQILGGLVGIAFVLKLLVSAVLLAPLGFAMGMPFPTGLHALEDGQRGTIEWAWAMNAGASVLGSVLAMIIAIHFGLGVTLAAGAACYVLAAALTVGFKGGRVPLAAA